VGGRVRAVGRNGAEVAPSRRPQGPEQERDGRLTTRYRRADVVDIAPLDLGREESDLLMRIRSVHDVVTADASAKSSATSGSSNRTTSMRRSYRSILGRERRRTMYLLRACRAEAWSGGVSRP
jgi:hypothetical protein